MVLVELAEIMTGWDSLLSRLDLSWRNAHVSNYHQPAIPPSGTRQGKKIVDVIVEFWEAETASVLLAFRRMR